MQGLFHQKERMTDFSALEGLINPRIENLFKFDIQKKREFIKSLQNTAETEKEETSQHQYQVCIFDSNLFKTFTDNQIIFRHWENNSTIFHKKFLTLNFDENMFLGQSVPTKAFLFIEKAILDDPNKRTTINIDSLHNELISLISQSRSRLFCLNPSTNEILMEANIEIEGVNKRQIKNCVQTWLPKLELYEKIKNLKHSYFQNVEKHEFLNQNFMYLLLSNFEDYINYTLVELKRHRTILQIKVFLDKLFEKIQIFWSYLGPFRIGNDSALTTNLIFKFGSRFCPDEDAFQFINQSKEIFFMPLMSIVQNIVFRNGEIELLFNNLGIQVGRNENFDYSCKNVPKILKPMINCLINTKHNYMLLAKSDQNLLELNLNLQLDILSDIHTANWNSVNEKIGIAFSQQKQKIDDFIERKFVS